MNQYKDQIKILVRRLLWVYVLFTLSRLLFFLLNKSSFQNLGFGELISICFYGLRFDTFSILVVNSLFILMSIWPFGFFYHHIYQLLLKWIFIFTNAIGLLLNFIDFAYYPYTQKRTTYDVVNMAFGGQSEMDKLIPLFLRDFWYVVLIFILCLWGLINRYNRIKVEKKEKFNYQAGQVAYYLFLFSITVGLTLIGIRGGLQRIPIGIVDAAKYTSPQYVPILINTPFSLIKSAELKTIQEYTFFSEEYARRFINPIHPADTGKFNAKNVVVIILESFSKEYTGISNRKSYTPFLDSLMNHSLVYTQAYANGKKSIEGIPAILSSMPSLMDDPYINSNYSNNNIHTLANCLKQKGYESAFFHGGTNGTMNFDSYSELAGFDHYYGRTEYANDADYDGQWGIWDEPFLKYMVKTCSEFKEPFLASVFTLSSHHPYKIPAQYEGKFPKGDLEIHESIGYTDYALRRFFEEAQKQTWYKNTIFVLTPDHTGISGDAYYSNLNGQYNIPIIFYLPDESLKGFSPKHVQQIDIMPGVLDYLNYDQPYYSFGTSVFGKNHPNIYYNNGNFYLVKDSLFYVVNDFKMNQVYRLTDSTLQNPVTGQYPMWQDTALDYTKAFIQTYNRGLIKNQTFYK